MFLSEGFKKRMKELAGIILAENSFFPNPETKKKKKKLRPNLEGAKIEILPVTADDLDELLDICNQVLKFPGFSDICTYDDRIKDLFQPELSFKAVLNDKPIGFYFCSDKEGLNDFLKETFFAPGTVKLFFDEHLYEDLQNKRGLQGVAVGILEEYRRFGIGRMLMDKPKELGYDYLWAVQTEHVSDVSKWLKRSQHLAHFFMKRNQRNFNITVEKYQ